MTETLQRIPLDLIGMIWTIHTALNILLDPNTGPSQKGMGWGNDTYALPIDERGQ